MDRDKYVDESWKDSVSKEKDGIIIGGGAQTPEEAPEQDSGTPALDFFNYIASLGFQALIFLGEMPNPITNQIEKNLRQAKFLIDTLILLREKTSGNLTKEESELLNSSIYELEMKYVEISQKDKIS